MTNERWVKKKLATIAINEGGKKVSVKLSDRAKTVRKYLSSRYPFGCRTEAVSAIMEILLGETITGPVKTEATMVIKGKFYVLTYNPNAHDYPLNQPILAKETGTHGVFLKSGNKSFTHGNNIPYVNGGAVRQASQGEVISFLEKASRYPQTRKVVDNIIG